MTEGILIVWGADNEQLAAVCEGDRVAKAALTPEASGGRHQLGLVGTRRGGAGVDLDIAVAGGGDADGRLGREGDRALRGADGHDVAR